MDSSEESEEEPTPNEEQPIFDGGMNLKKAKSTTGNDLLKAIRQRKAKLMEEEPPNNLEESDEEIRVGYLKSASRRRASAFPIFPKKSPIFSPYLTFPNRTIL